MNRAELIKELHTTNEAEKFYQKYQDAIKNASIEEFLSTINIEECKSKHYIIPEIKETMPLAMKDEYFFLMHNSSGISIEKHNRYAPEFSHFHTYFECVYVYHGHAKHRFNEKVSTLNTGDFVIIPPNVLHSIFVGDDSIIINLIISKKTIDDVFKNPTFFKDNILSTFFIENISTQYNKNMFFCKTNGDDLIKDLIITMMLEYENKRYEYETIIQSYISILYANLLRMYSSNMEIFKENSTSNKLVNDIKVYIDQHYNTVTLEELADKFYFTKEYLSKFIKDNLGTNFTSLLQITRLSKSINLLQNTGLSIGDISYQVGYENPESFSRLFKKYYNMKPCEFRKSLIESGQYSNKTFDKL